MQTLIFIMLNNTAMLFTPVWISRQFYSSNYESAHQEAAVGTVLPAGLRSSGLFLVHAGTVQLLYNRWHEGVPSQRTHMCSAPKSNPLQTRELPGRAHECIHKAPRETRVELL